MKQILIALVLFMGNVNAQNILSNTNELKNKLLDGIHLKGGKPYEKTVQLDQLALNLRNGALKMRLDSFVYFDSIASLNTFKNYYFYDAKHQNTTIDFYLWEKLTKKWMGFIHASFYYDTKGQIVETQSGDWNSQTNSFDVTSKVFNQYNAKGILVKDSTYVFDSGKWILDEKNEYTIANDKVAIAVQSDYDSLGWVNYAKNEYKYDGFGNLIEDLDFEWDISTMSWQENQKTTIAYNSDNQSIEQTIFSWDFNTSSFINDKRLQTAYNGLGLKTSQLELDWDQQNSMWLNVELFEVSYSPAKNPTKILIYSWSKPKSAWVNINLFLNTFDESVDASDLILPKLDIFYLLFQFDAFANGRPLTVAYYEQKKSTGEWGSRNRISFHYSQHQVTLLEEIKKNPLTIYPNPARDVLLCESDIVKGNFTITSTAGSYVKSGNYVKGEAIQISDLSCGIYILMLKDKQGQKYQTQFIKM